MSILLPASAVAFAAFCVWLTVRIVNRRERWAKWTLLVVVGLPVLYVASYGPACWISSRSIKELPRIAYSEFAKIPRIYSPIGSAADRWQVVSTAVTWYTQVWMPAGTYVFVPRHVRDGELVWMPLAVE